MCGIFGIFPRSPTATPPESALRESAAALRHRGPDDVGVQSGPGFGLAHTRLSLVDLNPRSNQPMWDRTGRYGLVYNGEVYNHRELRRQLEADGVVLRTTSDTEVLLEMFARRGVAATLPKLKGMFALGFLDTAEDVLTLARDRFGIKPLYYRESVDGFSFASEVVAFRPWTRLEPDLLTIASYLQGDDAYIGPTTRTSFFKGIRMVPPGWSIEVARGEPSRGQPFVTVRDQWDPDEARRLDAMSDDQLVALVDEGLNRAVEAQLFADAPVGVYLSGGVDSSLISAIANRYHPGISLFHADVVGKLSERPVAERVATHLGLELFATPVSDDDFLDQLPRVIRHYEYPFTGRPHSVPFLKVSELVREHGVKGVLSGEGSDECYFGYRKTIPRFHELVRGLPGRVVDRASASWRRVLGRRLPLRRRLNAYPWVARARRHQVATEMLNRFDRQIERQEVTDLLAGLREGDADPRNLQVLSLLHYHLRTLLHRNDRLGMAASVEARFPFLDEDLVRLAINLPYRCRVRLSRSLSDRSNPYVAGKWIVRKVAERYLPRDLSAMRKKGFKVNAAERMVFAPDAFDGTFVADLLGLSTSDLGFLMEHAPDALKVKMMQVNVWADVFLGGRNDDEIVRDLRGHVAVASERKRSRSATTGAGPG